MRKSISFILLLLVLDSCVERFEFSGAQGKPVEIVVDGVITDEPGPYTVKLSRTIQVGSTIGGLTISNAKITVFSDEGESEIMGETSLSGTYKTSATGIRGVVGREYWIKIELPDGRVFESLPDKMDPTGQIDSVYYQFETSVAQNGSKSYGFRIFLDSRITRKENSFTRWRFDGVYGVKTLPELNPVPGPSADLCATLPLPCSGYAKNDNGKLIAIGKCTCCDCWANQFEKKPTVIDNRSASEIKGLQVGFVPVNYYTFQDKYRVTVTQMSLSEKAYQYWLTFKEQKEGATSLFQPPYGKTESNLFKPSTSGKVVGIFHASAIVKRKIFIKKETNNAYLLAEVPLNCDGRFGPAGQSCLFTFPGSTNQKPDDWD
ncbi:MAG: DUF4249 domain-containing protein [Flammeovirgaceae bacterium]|jgi:hypothetical protein|nr:DUF4249 domain-containing protein [Flammeovirgaceae bacterium]